MVVAPNNDGLAAGTEPKGAAGTLSPPRDGTWAIFLAKSPEPNAGTGAAGAVVELDVEPTVAFGGF